MSTHSRRRMMIAGIGGISLATAGVMAPGAFAANTIDGDVKVSNTETVQVAMDASGKIAEQRIYEQLVLTGNGKVDIANPVSTKGLRNLDGFGGFDVRDGQARVKTDVSGTKKYRSVSTFTKKLPLDIKITYTLDGKRIDPSDVVGKSGNLEVRYVVTNTTGTSEDVSFKDGNGKETSSTEDVVVPMVGSLTTVLPSNFTKVETDGANGAGDGRGGTQLSFTMTLIPPIGEATAEFGYKAKVTDATIPDAAVSALPVNPLENASFKGAAASYNGGAQTGQDLTAGATTIDTNLLKIRDGASDLVAGILKLSDGANQLSAGLQNEAAPGAGKLAAGADKLDAGAGKLASGTGDLTAGANKLEAGAGDLSAGLKKASGGAPALLDGVAKLKAGAQLVDDGLVALNTGVGAGADEFLAQFSGSVDGIVTQLNAGLGGIIQAYLDPALAEVTGNANLTGAEKISLLTKIGTAKGGLQQVQSNLTNKVGPGLKAGVAGGLDKIKVGVAGAVGSPGADDTLRNGMAQIIGGLDQLTDKGGDLVDGLDQLSAGANKLSAGTGDLTAGANKLNDGAGQLKDGTGQLSTGAGTLAEGLGTAAEGSGKLADGLNQAAESAPALPEGADRLSKEGTSQLVKKGDATARDFGLRYAMLEAGAARAGTAQPYGSPEGAMALTAYKFEIAGEDGAGSANLKRGLAGVALLAGTGLFAGFRRRGLI